MHYPHNETSTGVAMTLSSSPRKTDSLLLMQHLLLVDLMWDPCTMLMCTTSHHKNVSHLMVVCGWLHVHQQRSNVFARSRQPSAGCLHHLTSASPLITVWQIRPTTLQHLPLSSCLTSKCNGCSIMAVSRGRQVAVLNLLRIYVLTGRKLDHGRHPL